MKLLIVDDSRAIHSFVSAAFKETGYKLEHAYNGEEAIELLKSNDDFDLILLDWEMPVLDGPGTLDRIKSEKIKSPAVMMTTKNKPDDIKKMLDAGVMDYIMKPITGEILLEKVRSLIGGAE